MTAAITSAAMTPTTITTIYTSSSDNKTADNENKQIRSRDEI